MEQLEQPKKKDPRHEKIVAALAEGLTWEQAAERIGIARNTLWRWCQADPELAAAAAEAREQADVEVENLTYLNCLDPDAAHNTLRMFWLKSRRPAVYRETTRQIVEEVPKSYDVANPPSKL